MSKDWQLRRGSLVAGHLSAVKLRNKETITNFFTQKVFLYFCLKINKLQ